MLHRTYLKKLFVVYLKSQLNLDKLYLFAKSDNPIAKQPILNSYFKSYL